MTATTNAKDKPQTTQPPAAPDEAAEKLAEAITAKDEAEAKVEELEKALDALKETEPFEPVLKTVAASKKVNVRNSPDKTSDANVLCTVDPSTEIEIAGDDEDGWTPVKITAYIKSELLA